MTINTTANGTNRQVTAHGLTAHAGTYTEYCIKGRNVTRVFIATEEEAQAELDRVNATYAKYGNVHTLKRRTVTITEWV